VDEDIVVIGLINAEHFVWPSGKSLKINGGNPNSSPEILSFPKREVDRTCLSTGNLAKPDPVAESFTGIKTVDILVEFINQKCNTYRTKHCYFSVEGLHRQEILSSLFKVKEISEFDIKTLLTESETRKGQYCSKIDCRKEINKISSLEDSDMRLQSEKSKDAGYMIASANLEHLLNFKDEELNIAKCEHAPLPSKDKFFHEYLKRSKPVIFKNAITHWPAMKKWTNEYFRTHYGDRLVHIKLTPLGKLEGVDFASNFENYNDFNIPPVVKEQLLFPDLVVVRPAEANMNFSAFIDTYESVANGSRSKFSAYLEYSSISDIMPELQDDIIEMPFMQKTLRLEHLNMWLSDGNTLGKLHFDPFDNFLCQVIYHCC
jgi:jumonji domain-containing protein 7